jgi:hypothetical protein
MDDVRADILKCPDRLPPEVADDGAACQYEMYYTERFAL